jgi:hypothetical protein
MKKKVYNIFVVIAFAALSFPLIVGFIKKDNKPNLTGIVINNVNPDSLLKKDKSMWFSGEYQILKDDYNNDHWAFKESYVRLNNQFYYELFNQIRVNTFVLGKDNYVYSEGYIFSAFGDDYIGKEKINSKLAKAKVVQDSLKRKGIDLLLVFAPGKGEYCIEHIEDKYKHTPHRTNYEEFVAESKKLHVNVLDLKAYFQKLKPTTPYPLFPKFGHHWSYYGECLAVDTIIKHVESMHHCDLPNILWNKIEVSDTARSRDADVLKSMNLYKNPNQHMQLAYPNVMWENDSLKNNVRILTIADSYWYGPVYMGVGQNAFAGGQFWYYYNKVIPSPIPGQKTEVWQLDLKQNIESNQVIMLLYSDGNLPNFANTFIDDAYELYTNPNAYYNRVNTNKKIKEFEKQIREKPVLLKKSTKKSQDLQIPLDSAIKLDAMKLSGTL